MNIVMLMANRLESIIQKIKQQQIKAPLQTTTLHERQIADLKEENTKLRLVLDLLDKRVAYLEKTCVRNDTWYDQDGNPLPQNQ